MSARCAAIKKNHRWSSRVPVLRSLGTLLAGFSGREARLRQDDRYDIPSVR